MSSATGSRNPASSLCTMDDTDVERERLSLQLFHLFTHVVFVWDMVNVLLNTCLPCWVSVTEVTLALLDAANDKDPEVQEQVRKSILTLGKQQPDRVLAMCQDYLLKHLKVRSIDTPITSTLASS